MLRSILHQQCPRCHQGNVFRSVIAMHESCPSCHLHFEREPGYFVGALYAAFFLAIVVMLMAMGSFLLLTRWSMRTMLAASSVILLLAMPAVFRYSRVIWMYLERAVDPEE